jgi:hypothetical protein
MTPIIIAAADVQHPQIARIAAFANAYPRTEDDWTLHEARSDFKHAKSI